MKIYHYLCLAGLLFPISVTLQAQKQSTAVENTMVQTANQKASADYPINYAKDAKITHASRSLQNIYFRAGNRAEQQIAVNQQNGKLLYNELLSQSFAARAGETITPRFGWTGTWMNGYIYLDVKQDGKFDVVTKTEGTGDNAVTTIVDGTDLMAYSHFKGKNSQGKVLTGGQTSEVNPPTFKLPADLKPGVYRLRYKIDWDDVDPAGSTIQSIIENGGAIVDTRLIVHEGQVKVYTGTRSDGGGMNGEVLLADGTPLVSENIRFGKALDIRVKPAENYVFSHLVLRHGFGIEGGDSIIHGTPQFVETIVPSYLFKGDTYTIPSEYVDGDVLIIPYFVKDDYAGGEDYALNFDKNLMVAAPDTKLRGFKMVSAQDGTSQIRPLASVDNTVYRDMLNKEVPVVPGDRVTASVMYNGKPMHAYLYVDYNQDGRFSPSLTPAGVPTVVSELASFTYYQGKNSVGETVDADDAGYTLPAFNIPESLPVGFYRARLKVDRDNVNPGGQWKENGTIEDNQIDLNGGYVIDFLLNVHRESGKLEIETLNGSLVGKDMVGLPLHIGYNQSLQVYPFAAAEGYEADSIYVRHGHNLNGEQYIHGNCQWKEYAVPVRNYNLPGVKANGDVRMTLNYEATDHADMELKFSDEFNQEDGSQPDATKWARSPRYGAAWNRFNAQTEEGQKQTAYIEDGKLVTLCMANHNPAEKNKDGQMVEMINGAVESNGQYGFTYGKVEGRLMTYGHKGNFPAFWMMPVNQPLGWPKDGEIDIWEQIDTENRSYHTIHTNWANNLGQSNNPKKSGTSNTTTGNYHVYGLEWTADKLVWFVDGKQVFSYAKSKVQDHLDKGQWPYDKDFFLILNQSVGNGSWASNPDLGHTYRTLFDWVRVYQKKTPHTGIESVEGNADLDFYVSGNQIRLVAPQSQLVIIYDMQGRMVYRQTIQGNVNLNLPKGMYVLNGQKLLVH